MTTTEVAPRKKIAVATAAAAIVATVVLVTTIFPAEYGIDPLGTGRVLGLTKIANSSAVPQVSAGIPGASIIPELDPKEQTSRWGTSPTMKGTYISQSDRFQFDSREIELQPRTGIEIKYHMKKGAGLVYSWDAGDNRVLFEFHGEPEVKPAGKQDADYFESYQRDDRLGLARASGTFIAPSEGIHGWYWENRSSKVVKIRLVAAGYYDWVYRSARGKPDSLKPMDVYSLPSHPTVPDEDME
jgi:hypothetical protein